LLVIATESYYDARIHEYKTIAYNLTKLTENQTTLMIRCEYRT